MFARALRLATLCILASGCSTYEKQYEDTRLVLASDGCPSDEAVTAESYGDEAEFAGARTIERKPLCWYRLEGQTSHPYPECGDESSPWPTLESIRAPLRTEVSSDEHPDLPGMSSFQCTDEGLVWLVVPPAASCEELDGRRMTDIHPGVKGNLVVRELIAVDARPALLLCTYSLTGERTRRLFQSGR